MTEKQNLWARQCDVTLEGMNEGWVVGDGDAYFKYEKDALEWATDVGYANLEEAYEDDAIYWTEWDDETDRQYIEIDGVLCDVEDL